MNMREDYKKRTGHDLHGPADHLIATAFCQICNGGLLMCKVCNGAESSMPSNCPGRQMDQVEEGAVTAGTLDFRAGKWWIAQEKVNDMLRDTLRDLESVATKLHEVLENE